MNLLSLLLVKYFSQDLIASDLDLDLELLVEVGGVHVVEVCDSLLDVLAEFFQECLYSVDCVNGMPSLSLLSLTLSRCSFSLTKCATSLSTQTPGCWRPR